MGSGSARRNWIQEVSHYTDPHHLPVNNTSQVDGSSHFPGHDGHHVATEHVVNLSPIDGEIFLNYLGRIASHDGHDVATEHVVNLSPIDGKMFLNYLGRIASHDVDTEHVVNLSPIDGEILLN